MGLARRSIWPPRPDRTFLALGLVAGLTLVFLNPPLQGPDEGAHLRRAYQLSLGRVLARNEGGYAGEILPTSLHGTAMRALGRLCLHPERRLTWEAYREVLALPLDPERTTFAEFRNTAVYSPLPYLPQSALLALARLAETRPLFLLYLGRLAGLASWLGLIFAAIRVAPFGRWLLVAVALSPVAMVEGAVLNADSITIGLGFLTLALGLALAARADTQPYARRDLAAFVAAAAALALCKFVYATLALLVLAMPRPRTVPLRRHLAVLAAVLALVAIAWSSWSTVATRLWLETRLAQDASLGNDSDPDPLANGPRQTHLREMLLDPAPHLALIGRTLVHEEPWMRAIASIDWGVALPRAPSLVLLLLLVGIGVLSGAREPALTLATRGLLVAAAAAAMLGPYLIHCALGANLDAPYIRGVHGRYWVPVVPALLLAISSGRFSGAARFLPQLAIGASLLSFGLTCWALLHRYYLP